MLCIGQLELENGLVMAPMAGITNLAFRLMVKKLGAGLVTSEMVSAEGLSRGKKKTFAYLKTDPNEQPLAVQIFGCDPRVMARAAQIVAESGASVVDINMGCPVKKIVKTGAGASLLRDPRGAAELLTAVRLACPVPLTVKIRPGWSPREPVVGEIARIVEDCGADAISVHPRYASQGFSGRADWRLIGEVKERVKIPVIGNGDICAPQDARKMKRQTGCDGVMIGRGAVGNPWLFAQILSLEEGSPVVQPGIAERRELIIEHFRLLSLLQGEYRAALNIRGLLLAYTKGLPHSSRFRGSIARIRDSESLVSAMDSYFSSLKVEGI